MFEWIYQPEAWAALATLTVLEIVLGIDNIVFLSILSGRLPAEQQQKARLVLRRRHFCLPCLRCWLVSLRLPRSNTPATAQAKSAGS